MVAILIVSACALFGPLLGPLTQSHRRGGRYFMAAFISLGVGVLVGDALLHLMPAAFGVHNHDDGHDHDEGEGDDHDHDHDHEPVSLTLGQVMGLGLTVFAGIYLFFLVEKTLFAFTSGHSHGHSHGGDDSEEPIAHGYACAHGQDHAAGGDVEHAPKALPSEDTHLIANPDASSSQRSLPALHEPKVNSQAYMVLVGDSVHNLIDGLVIGIAFSSDPYTGISTTLAVVLHEIPHEIGDFAILLDSGMPFKKACIYSLISQLTAFFGGACGVGLGEIGGVQPYLLALTAGMFLYLGLVDLVRLSSCTTGVLLIAMSLFQLPELAHNNKRDSYMMMFVRHAGLLLGVGLMCVVLYVEEQFA